jgi:outer membrane protein assembly factor BamB
MLFQNIAASIFPPSSDPIIDEQNKFLRLTFFSGLTIPTFSSPFSPPYPNEAYDCCKLRGAVVALNANTGAIKWKTHTAPAGYYSVSVWGSNFSVDKKRDLLYVPTGNNSEVPLIANACQKHREGTLSAGEETQLTADLAAISATLPGHPTVVCGQDETTSATPKPVVLRKIFDGQKFIVSQINLNDAFVPTVDQTGAKSFGNYPDSIVAIHLKDKNDARNHDVSDYDGIDSDGDGLDADSNFDSTDNAMGVKAGDIAWVFRSREYDQFFAECANSNILPFFGPNDLEFVAPATNICRLPEGPDADFAQAPMLLKKGNTEILVSATKAGLAYALNPDNEGAVLWIKKLGIHGLEGGSEFGSATDNNLLYIPQNQSINTSFSQLVQPGNHNLPAGTQHTHTLCQRYSNQDDLNPLLVGTAEPGCQVAPGSMASTRNSYISAMDPLTGNILWQSADPNGPEANPVQTLSGISVANDVLFIGSRGVNVQRIALDAKTGEIIWTHNNVIAVNNKPSIVNGVVYWGGGYPPTLDTGVPNVLDTKLYAFELCPLGTHVSADKLSCIAN